MTTSLAANFVAFGGKTTQLNHVLPWEEVSISFTNPPADASDVVVRVKEDVKLLHGSHKFTEVGRFLGELKGGKFIVNKIIGAPPQGPDQVGIHIVIGGGAHKGRFVALSPEPENVVSHELTLQVEAPSQPTFTGTHPLHIEYPLAMVVPKPGTTLDTALSWLQPWAQQWQQHNKQFRKVIATPFFVSKSIQSVDQSHFEAWINHLVEAAKFATSGVVFLAVGHGAPQSGQEVSWVNLVPEDNKKAVTGVTYQLSFDQNDLQPYAQKPKPGGVTAVPGGSIKQKLHALDRLADALQGTWIRRLILHTCRVGQDGNFIQLLADRMRVPVRAQKNWIVYRGLTAEEKAQYPDHKSSAFYEHDNPVLPQALRQVPISQLGSPKFPQDPPPPRFGA